MLSRDRARKVDPMTIEHTKTDDKRDVAAYTLSAAARHVGMPAATLRQWGGRSVVQSQETDRPPPSA